MTVARLVAALSLVALTQRASAQTLEVRPDSGRVTVGDPVLFASSSASTRVTPSSSRCRNPSRHWPTACGCSASTRCGRSAPACSKAGHDPFYRPGPQTIPAFAIDFRRGAVILHGTMRSEPVPIEVAAVLIDGGGPTLRDIRELVEVPGPDPRLVMAIAAMLAGAAWALRRRRDRHALVLVPALATVDVGADAPDPFAGSLDRRSEIERAAGRRPERWPGTTKR